MARRAAAPQPSETLRPPDEEDATHSGKLLLRMPPSLHAELSREAEQEGVSLNAFITSALAGAVHWRSRAEGSAPAPRRRHRALTAVLIADAVLVGLAGALAIVLLIVAWP
jgi:HicB family